LAFEPLDFEFFWDLGFGASLELGSWCLELLPPSFDFSLILSDWPVTTFEEFRNAAKG
jgi:hypothetical protein